MKKNIVVLTGAGISAESGIQTFRDSNGLWENYDVKEVASPAGWKKDRALVLKFYNERRRKVKEAKPNKAHFVLKDLEQYFNVNIITQNIDDLHERAGSTNIMHIHGQINQMCSSLNRKLTYPCHGDIEVGDKAKDGSQLRPDIVWFGEDVPLYPKARKIVQKADILIIIGTSMQVYPAASLVSDLGRKAQLIILNPNDDGQKINGRTLFVKETATKGMPKIFKVLVENYVKNEQST